MDNNQGNFNNYNQNDYYNNDSYYSNSAPVTNYSEATYEEKKGGNNIWWKILLIILILLIIILLLLKFCGNGGKSKEERHTELTYRVCEAAKKYLANNPTLLSSDDVGKTTIIKFKTLSDANLIEAKIENPLYDGTLFKKGTVERYYSVNTSLRVTMYSDGARCEIVDNSQDVTPPELRLNGDAEITLAVGTDFEDPGYTATDDYDGDITDKVVRSGKIPEEKTAGTYTLTYTVQDSAGNVTTKTRKVIYEEYSKLEISLGSILDGVTPMIQLKGANPYCMVVGSKYVEPGATATDNVDGNITDRISVTNKVSGNLIGSFRIVYKVEDSSGNQAIAYRAVIVSTSCPNEKNTNTVTGNSAPVITLVGKSSVTINKGTEYIDLGATAYDKEDGDITSKVITDASQVKVNVAGVYKVIYRVTDSDGKTVTKTRTVTVKDPVNGNPSVRFTENKENITVEVGSGNDGLISAPKAVDEKGRAVTVTKSIEDYITKQQVSAIDWNSVGKYRVTYTAIHSNKSVKQTKTIIVNIINNGITIGGKNPIEVTVRTTNCDLTENDLTKGGVTIESVKTPIVTLEKHEGIACKIGTYVIIVNANTGDGLEVSKEITVKVVDGTAPVIPKNAPSKTIITGNSANPTNVHNTNEIWVGGEVTGIHVDFKSTPAPGTELAYFEYSKNCRDVDGKAPITSTTQGSMYWTEEGKNKVCIRAVNKNGEAGPWSDIVNLYIDLTGPNTRFTHTWASGMSDWHNTPDLTVTYTATDTGSGIDHYEYTYDDVKAHAVVPNPTYPKDEDLNIHSEGTGSLTVNGNTEPNKPQLYVYVRAVDKAGNKGEWTQQPAYINVDTYKPNTPTVVSVEGNNTKIARINVKAIDAVSLRPSGIGKFAYTMNDGTEQSVTASATVRELHYDGSSGTPTEDEHVRKGEYTGSITLPANDSGSDRTYNVKIWAVDRAGNRSEGYASQSVTVKSGTKATGIEMKNGSTVIANGASCGGSISPQGTITLTATVIPSNADDKTIVWSISNTSVASIDNGKVTAKTVGEAIVTARAGTVSTTCKLVVTNKIICAAGNYLPKGTSTCQKCVAGYSCTGGTFEPNGTYDQGITACKAGTFSAAGATSCTPCATGSYNNVDASTKCVACPGKTTSGAGQTNCTVNCSNAANVAKWNTATWNSNNTVTNLCNINACNSGYNLSNNSCTAAPAPTPDPTPAPTISCNVSNCNWCSSNNYCGSCRSGYTLSNGQCVPSTPTCGSRQKLYNGQCVTCTYMTYAEAANASGCSNGFRIGPTQATSGCYSRGVCKTLSVTGSCKCAGTESTSGAPVGPVNGTCTSSGKCNCPIVYMTVTYPTSNTCRAEWR